MGSVTYDRPVAATLHVHLENGETFEASADDIAKFGYIHRLDTYASIDKVLSEVAQQINDTHDVTNTEHLNVVRYLCEVLISYPRIFEEYRNDGQTYESLFKGLREIAALDLAPEAVEHIAGIVEAKMRLSAAQTAGAPS